MSSRTTFSPSSPRPRPSGAARRVAAGLAALAALCAGGPARAGDLGTNLDAVVDYSPQHPFVDAFKTSRSWLTQTETVWDTGDEASLALDADGWVTSLPAPGSSTYDRVATLLFQDTAYPAGQYVVTYDGVGTLEYRFDAQLVQSTPGRDVLSVTPSGGFAIVLRATTPGNHLRNLRVWMPGFDETNGPAQYFHPDFLDLLQGTSTLRFMDWMHTNSTTQQHFADRPLPSHARWTLEGKGVPIEIMVRLANRTRRSPWFTLPHLATDAYVTAFATLVRDTLHPSLVVYVEHSNEVWNDTFPQGAAVEAQGEANFPGGASGFTKRLNQHGRRTAEICDLWQAAWGAQASRVRCVLGAAAVNDFTATEAADCPLWNGAPCTGHGLWGVAIAPYFAGYLGASDTASTVAGFTLDQLFTEITTGGVLAGGPAGGAIAETVGWVAAHRAAASARGLALVAYEGGQHLVGHTPADQDNVAMASLFVAANRDARMGAAYASYLANAWQAEGGELFVHFTAAGTYSKYGSWGAVERSDQPATPKNLALKAWADRLFSEGFESGSTSGW